MTEDDRLLALALSLTDGTDVDWAREGAIDDPALAGLRAVEAIARATAAASPPAAPGQQRFGPLRVLEKLGTGASGDVFRAWDTRLEREVALKLLRTPDGPDSRLVREARLLARVRHPAVMTVYGVETFEGKTGLWGELVRGRTLAALVEERGAFTAREAALIGIEVCAGLQELHSAGLVHGDVKAGNVMREDGGRVVLLDFSSARSASGLEGDVSGTPLYLAPEVLSGEAAPSPRSDVYAVGVLLYFLVSGQHPVRAATLDGLRRAHARGGRRKLRDERRDLPTDFAAVVERALAPPRQRHGSAAALQADLRQWLAPRGVSRRWVAMSAVVVVCGLAAWFAPRPAPGSRGPVPATREAAPRPAATPRPVATIPLPVPEVAPSSTLTAAAVEPPLEEPAPASNRQPTPETLHPSPEPVPSAEISEWDRLREEGERVFEESLLRMSEKADAVAAAWSAYREACVGKSATVPVTEGPSAGTTMLVPMEGTPECLGRRADAESLSAMVRSRLDEAEAAARHSRVEPGRVRDLERRYGFDSSFWQP